MTVAMTGGSVTFERKIKPADYESKGAIVQLSFNIADGQDTQAVLDEVSKMAMGQALKMVGVQEQPGKTKADLEKEALDRAGQGNPPAASSKSPRKPPSSKKTEEKADPAKDPAAVDDAPAGERQVSANPEDRKDPAAVDDALFSAADAPKEITDAELMQEITAHNAKVKNAPEIRKLIGEYVKPPGQARDIPQNQREAFVKKLKEIKEPLAK